MYIFHLFHICCGEINSGSFISAMKLFLFYSIWKMALSPVWVTLSRHYLSTEISLLRKRASEMKSSYIRGAHKIEYTKHPMEWSVRSVLICFLLLSLVCHFISTHPAKWTIKWDREMDRKKRWPKTWKIRRPTCEKHNKTQSLWLSFICCAAHLYWTV